MKKKTVGAGYGLTAVAMLWYTPYSHTSLIPNILICLAASLTFWLLYEETGADYQPFKAFFQIAPWMAGVYYIGYFAWPGVTLAVWLIVAFAVFIYVFSQVPAL